MGKARIYSRVGRGLYTVEPIYDTAGRDSQLAELSAEITLIEGELAQVESRIASLDSVISGRLSFVDSLLQELRDAVATELERADKAKQIEAIRLDMASSFDLFSDREAEATGAYQQMISELEGEIADMEGAAGFATELRARIDEVMAGLAPLSRDLGQARHEAAMLHIRRANSLQQRDALLAAEPPAVVEAWCADYSTKLPIGAEVATIEVPGEPAEVLIYPQAQGEGMHHAPRDGIVSMRAWQAPEQAYLNAALLPGWQRHRPTYRFGILFNLDREQNLCDVQLSPFDRSSAQGLRINPGEPLQQWVLRNVPITYMQCHGEAFEEGDEVVVRFLDQSWSRPVVIGVRRFPRRCAKISDVLLTQTIHLMVKGSDATHWEATKCLENPPITAPAPKYWLANRAESTLQADAQMSYSGPSGGYIGLPLLASPLILAQHPGSYKQARLVPDNPDDLSEWISSGTFDARVIRRVDSHPLTVGPGGFSLEYWRSVAGSGGAPLAPDWLLSIFQAAGIGNPQLTLDAEFTGHTIRQHYVTGFECNTNDGYLRPLTSGIGGDNDLAHLASFRFDSADEFAEATGRPEIAGMVEVFSPGSNAPAVQIGRAVFRPTLFVLNQGRGGYGAHRCVYEGEWIDD